jgi:hypothetical protein
MPPLKESFRRCVRPPLWCLPKEFCERRFLIHRPATRAGSKVRRTIGGTGARNLFFVPKELVATFETS